MRKSSLLLAAGMCLATLTLTVGPAMADPTVPPLPPLPSLPVVSPGTVSQFSFPSASEAVSGGHLVTGPDGYLWFTSPGGNFIGRVSPQHPGDVQEYPLPTAGAAPTGITVGPDHNIWFTESKASKIGRISVAAPHTVTEFATPTANSDPEFLSAGPDGNVWFIESGGNHVGRILTAAPNTVTEFTLPKPHPELGAIVAGPDGNMWYGASCGASTADNYCGTSAGYVARILTATPNTVTEFLVAGGDGAGGSAPVAVPGIIRKGQYLWFTEAGGNNISRIASAAPNTLNEWSIPTANSAPQGLTQGPDGDIYFAEAQGNKIGRLHTDQLLSDNPIQEYTVPQPANGQVGGPAPSDMTLGPDGNVWFLDANANDVGRLTLHDTPADLATAAADDAQSAAGSQLPAVIDPVLPTLSPGKIPPITTYPIPCPNGQATCGTGLLTSMLTGPDGDLWFTDASRDFIGRVNPHHPAQITEYPMPPGGAVLPYATPIFVDGKLWFTLQINDHATGGGNGAVAVLNPNAPPTSAITEYPVPDSLAGPGAIVLGPDRKIWFTAVNQISTAIGSLDPRAANPGATYVAYPISQGSFPSGVTVGPDGNLWFSTSCDGQPTATDPCANGGAFIGRLLTTAPHTITEWYVPGAFNAGAVGVAGPTNADGYIWFYERGANKIGRISPRAGHEIIQWSLPSAKAYPWQMTADDRGNLLFSEPFTKPTGKIATLDTHRLLSNNLVTEYPVPPPASGVSPFPAGITISKDQDVWFTYLTANYLGRLDK